MTQKGVPKVSGIPAFIESTNLNSSLLVGYYGGGNFGDELLLEILLQLFKKSGKQKVDIYYLHPEYYDTYHQPLNYSVIGARSLLASSRGFLRAKNIVVGGGGLWGL